MASNAIPTGINDLFRLSSEAAAGAAALGTGIPLLINTSGEIGSNRGNLFQLESVYQGTLGQLKDARAALITARVNGRAFATTARKWLEHTYGTRYNASWRQVGYIHNDLQTPADDGDLAALLEKMGLHLGNNPSLENTNPKINVTAARANTFASALTAAINSLNGKEQDSVNEKQARDTAKKVLRKRLSGLVGELGQRLARDDGRWRRFGLNLPSAPNVPAVPKEVAVNTNTPGEFFITCAPAKYATHYRFFTQRPGVDAEPVHVGNADDPMTHLAGLTPGETFLVYVSASNSGAESRLSTPVTATVATEAEAAA